MPVDTHLKQRLEALDEKYCGDEMFRIFGPTMFSWATTDSSRMYMFTSHLKQALSLLEPDVPRLQTGFENTVGKYNRAYKQLKGHWTVKQIIPKFTLPKEIQDDPEGRAIQIYMVVLYNEDTDTYEMIEKPVAENLTEKFGYLYNTTFMENLQEGDRLVDPILFKSTAYDDHMNYRYGKNARVYYSTSTDTIEDAIVVRRGWAEHVKSVEIDSVQVPINDNDIMLNLYGDDSHYQPFPNIGQYVKDSLICATRRINKSHLLYDFQKAAMTEVMDTDIDYYTSKNSIVYDINVYYNGDEPFPSNLFNRQLKQYYEDGCRYAAMILDACNRIKESGSKYTQNVSYYRAKYLEYNNPEYKWKNRDKTFSHINIEFKVKSIVDIELGGKLTGRFGNKGVVSRIMDEQNPTLEDAVVNMLDDGNLTEDDKRILRSKIKIVDDERMPYYLRDGVRIYADIMCNASGAIRRLNPGQLVEVETNFIAEQVQYMIQKAPTLGEKERLLFKFLDICNHDQQTFFRTMYDKYDYTETINGIQLHMMAPESKKAFIANVEKYGFYIVRPPHKPLLYDDVIRMYNEFPEIRPMDIYIDIFGTKQRKMMRPGVIGYQYMLVLKQNSNKNFSARSTFRVNRSNLPAKDIAKKTNRSSYARTPVRLSEIYSLLCAVSDRDLAEYNIFMRSSALGRKSLDRILAADGNPLKIKKLKVQDNFTNANADILAAKLKMLGIRIFMSPHPEGRIQVYDDMTITPLHFGPYLIYDYPRHRAMYQALFNAFEDQMKSLMLVESYPGEKHDICWDRVFEDETLKAEYDLTPELRDQLATCTKGHLSTMMNQIARANRRNGSAPGTTTTTGKKRGRKSKAEKEALQREMMLEAQRKAAAEAEEESEDDTDEQATIINEILDDEPENEDVEDTGITMDETDEEDPLNEDDDDEE